MSDKPTVRLPQLWGVVYAQPNRSGQRKSCGNCAHANIDVSQCAVVSGGITPEMVCGYHVESGSRVPPFLAGLETVVGGTSCDGCVYYAPVTDVIGRCAAVVTPAGQPEHVNARGCCARWERA